MLLSTMPGGSVKPERVHRATASRYHDERRILVPFIARHDCSDARDATDESVQNAIVARLGKRATSFYRLPFPVRLR
ncbi:hypothetical protein [Rhodopseudomonas sp. P2A-2r]|uniref:hypothetical protein n=1 Tax=unclassified Rhodopseudomonas TaxID=2638247 RepID=UPI0022346EF4|nr:hypothetical protein [Rhodopseudomonas sp. P2A-2r]UZE47161.1 hypothetical protein ONR75_19465 [Rhodopseudomonas sp. P2A-2r]